MPPAASSNFRKNRPTRFATRIQNGNVNGFVTNVTSADNGTLALAGSARKAAKNICPTGTINAENRPSATPRGTDLRVNRHNSGDRNRCAIGARYLFLAISSRDGIYFRIRSAPKVLDLKSTMVAPPHSTLTMRQAMGCIPRLSQNVHERRYV